MLRKIRILLAALLFAAVTILFLDFTGALRLWLGWVAKIQFLPALLALNLAVVVVMALLTLLFGRIYCSVVCPLGVFQDCVSHISGSRKGKKARFGFSKEIKWLRYGVLVLFIGALVAGVGAVVSLLAPYSSYGRMVQNLLSPLAQWGNNALAWLSERAGGYSFATKEVWIKSLPTFIVAALTFVAVVVLAWRNGRTYCNTICPVGTFLSFLSRFAMFRPMIDTSVCKDCGSCGKRCKASCIDTKNHSIDHSRCVVCFDCLEDCKFGAIKYRFAWGCGAGKTAAEGVTGAAACSDGGKSVPDAAGASAGIAGVGHVPGVAETSNASNPSASGVSDASGASSISGEDGGRRAFLVGGALALGSGLLSSIPVSAQEPEKKRDGGFAEILPKKAPAREVPLTPFGSKSVKFFYQHCTACQLCVAVCPNDVLRPSTSLDRFMQPEMSFEKGYCRPECVKCSEVCPSGAILRITPEEKTQWKIGTASVDLDLCVALRDGVECGNCARHCPVNAIVMVSKDPNDNKSPKVPAVRRGRCIGCGACEALCPSRPISAIKVEGNEVHHCDGSSCPDHSEGGMHRNGGHGHSGPEGRK